MLFFSLLAGTRVSSWRAIEAFRIRASKSPIGSVIMASPARFRHARELAFERQLPHAQTAQAKVAIDATDTTADAAAVDSTGRKLGRTVGFRPLRCARHDQLLNGIPRLPSSSLASSSVSAVVTNVMFMPLILSTLS